LTFVLNISHVIDQLHLSGALDAGKLDVRLVPVRPPAPLEGLSVARPI